MYLSERVINSTSLTILQSLEGNKQRFYEDKLKFDLTNHNWFVNSVFKAVALYEKITN